MHATDELFVMMVENGEPDWYVAERCDLTTSQVRQKTRALRLNGHHIPRRKADMSPEAVKERRRAVKEMTQRGIPAQQIADDLGIHFTTVYKLRK